MVFNCSASLPVDVKAMGSRDLPAGALCVTQDDDLHQISNLQAGSADLVTLHVYSPPLGDSWKAGNYGS